MQKNNAAHEILPNHLDCFKMSSPTILTLQSVERPCIEQELLDSYFQYKNILYLSTVQPF